MFRFMVCCILISATMIAFGLWGEFWYTPLEISKWGGVEKWLFFNRSFYLEWKLTAALLHNESHISANPCPPVPTFVNHTQERLQYITISQPLSVRTFISFNSFLLNVSRNRKETLLLWIYCLAVVRPLGF